MSVSEPRLQKIIEALAEVPPARLASDPWLTTERSRRPSSLRRGLVMASLAVFVAAAVVVSGLAASSSTPRLNPKIVKRFSVFAMKGTPASPEAIRIAKILTSHAPYNENFKDMARSSFRVAQQTRGWEVIVFGNSTDVCIVANAPHLAADGGCTPQEIVASGNRLTCGTTEPPGWKAMFFACLIPNGVRHVAVTTHAGTEHLTVVNNTVAAAVNGSPLRVSWSKPNGERAAEQLIH